MMDHPTALGIRARCRLLEISRSCVYYRPCPRDAGSLAGKIEALYQAYPMYGYRRLTACLRREGFTVNGKRVLRLMRRQGLCAIYPAPRTTVVDQGQRKYPYALKDLVVTKPHHVWQMDITYLRTDRGFMYLNALIDRHSRYVVGWSLSNTLDTESCVRTLEKALHSQGVPAVINSDQGCQFTSQDWVSALQSHGITISMTGKGRSNDNAHIERLWRTLKYEWTYLKGIRRVHDYKRLLPAFMDWYNNHRPHQALGYQTPAEMMANYACGYVDKAYALTHIPTAPTTTTNQLKNSLIL